VCSQDKDTVALLLDIAVCRTGQYYQLANGVTLQLFCFSQSEPVTGNYAQQRISRLGRAATDNEMSEFFTLWAQSAYDTGDLQHYPIISFHENSRPNSCHNSITADKDGRPQLTIYRDDYDGMQVTFPPGSLFLVAVDRSVFRDRKWILS
jgi:hypothetical protein